VISDPGREARDEVTPTMSTCRKQRYYDTKEKSDGQAFIDDAKSRGAAQHRGPSSQRINKSRMRYLMAIRTRHIPASVSRSQWARTAASRQSGRLRERRVTRRPHIISITCIRPIDVSAGAASLWGSRMRVRRGEGWLGLEFRFPRFSPLQSASKLAACQHSPLLSSLHIIPSTPSHIATRLFAAHFAVCLIIWRLRQCLTGQSERACWLCLRL